MAKTKKLTAREWVRKEEPNIKLTPLNKVLLINVRTLLEFMEGFASQFKPKPTRKKKLEYPFYPDGPEGDGKQNQNNKG